MMLELMCCPLASLNCVSTNPTTCVPSKIITPDSGIVITSIDPFTGDITYEFDMTLELCYYRRESGFW